MRPPLALGLAVMVSACAGPDVGASIPGGGAVALEPRLASLSATVFVPRCASVACHGGTGNVPVDLSSARAAYDAMVNQVSTQAGYPLVAPYEPDRSYLLVRVRGAQAGAEPMPPAWGGEPLSDAEVAAISDWVANGALDD